MRRQGQYGDSSVNYASQVQHMSAQRIPHGSGINHFSGRADAFPNEEENPYISSKADGQWQWDRDGAKGPNSISSQLYNEGEGGAVSRTFYPSQRSDSRIGFEKHANKDPKAQPHQQDMETGYDDNALPHTFEGLTQKFHDEIMKLTKEQHEAEDTENARHREKLGDINAKYQEKLSALRAQHANRRDDFLERESQTRKNQYQQAGMSHYQNPTGQSDLRSYGGAAAAATAVAAADPADLRRTFASGQYDSYRERAQYLEDARNHGFESRGPYPGGRSYNNNARYY
ncbi:Ubiquitin carboxyl-terminal hydrolase [Thalictrum thalictroides]|uniref:Ubiquitin carboxyl-terminal hydrolase n=1 Tax=Thalictrum thalictroides TaxID=46969 RepID=A0A7J6W8T8_THATH|nr:Ubiquitin carboxyl-terminal hydrolase [Thalictrum thalictroides]